MEMIFAARHSEFLSDLCISLRVLLAEEWLCCTLASHRVWARLLSEKRT